MICERTASPSVRNDSLTGQTTSMQSGRDCISVTMMGVSCSEVSAVTLNVDARAALGAELFNTINLGVENGGQGNRRQFDHTDQPQLVFWLCIYENCRHPILHFNSGACHGRGGRFFSNLQTAIHP